jgi:hypothetical protein
MRIQDLPPFQHVRWRPDREELRKFSLSMLIGFAVLGLLAAWRHHGFGTTTYALWTAGLLLAAGGQVPGLGRLVYLLVYLPTSLIGYVVSHVILFLIFWLLFVPLGLLLRLAGKDLLRLRRAAAPAWIQRPPHPHADRYYRQF